MYEFHLTYFHSNIFTKQSKPKQTKLRFVHSFIRSDSDAKSKFFKVLENKINYKIKNE